VRLLFDLSGEFNLRRNMALFANLNNLTDEPVDVEIAGPSTPNHAASASGRPLARCGRLA
jgi:hypothetical protein